MTPAKYACALVAAVLLSVNSARADKDQDEAKGKPKAKDAPPTVIQIDVSKLPPDLAKALIKFAETQGNAATPDKKPSAAPEKKPAPVPEKKPAPLPEKKPAAPEKKPEAAKENITLPPGLAKKPKDHPGRVHYIEHVLKMRAAGTPAKGAPQVPPGKKKDQTDSDEE